MSAFPALSASLVDALWSASKLKTFHACPKKFKYRYIDNLGEPQTGAQAYGTTNHAALEAWLIHFHEGSEVRLAKALEAIQLTDPFEAARARAVILGYELRWGEIPWRVLGVEAAFSYELDGHVIHGYIDAIVEDQRDGRVYVVEHKNSAADISQGSNYWEQLTIDLQVSIYCDGAAMLGYDVAGVIYDVLAKPKHAPQLATPLEKREFTKGKGCTYCGGSAGGKRGIVQGRGSVQVDGKELNCLACGGDETKPGNGWKEGIEVPRLHANHRTEDETAEAFEARVCEAIAENPEAFYQRAVIVRTEDEMPLMRGDVLATIAMARVSTALNLFPRNTGNCKSFGSMCFFFALCNRTADMSDPRFSSRKSSRPELTALP